MSRKKKEKRLMVHLDVDTLKVIANLGERERDCFFYLLENKGKVKASQVLSFFDKDVLNSLRKLGIVSIKRDGYVVLKFSVRVEEVEERELALVTRFITIYYQNKIKEVIGGKREYGEVARYVRNAAKFLIKHKDLKGNPVVTIKNLMVYVNWCIEKGIINPISTFYYLENGLFKFLKSQEKNEKVYLEAIEKAKEDYYQSYKNFLDDLLIEYGYEIEDEKREVA